MGRNQFKKVRSRPLKKSEAEEVRQGKGVPFRRALHTFGTPCTLRCTPFSIEVCRRFLLFSLVYEPFPMLSCLPARHAHLFSNDLYTRERDIYFFIYKTYKMVCIVCSTPKTPDKSGFKLHTMAKNGVQDSVHGVQGSVHERRNAQIGTACQAHAASLLYVHPHPTAARRAATLASSEREMRKGARISLRPLQRRFKARKKPEGYTRAKNVLNRA